MKGITKKYLLLIIILGGISVIIIPIFAHPGRTDSSGCHTCRTNCPSWGLSYGEYHCHRSKGLPQPKPPVKSHREGYTEPAPEYEVPVGNIQSTTKKEQQNGSSKEFTAQASQKDTKGISIWWWIIGMGIVGYIFYKLGKRKN